jgi:hypothetical protein
MVYVGTYILLLLKFNDNNKYYTSTFNILLREAEIKTMKIQI